MNENSWSTIGTCSGEGDVSRDMFRTPPSGSSHSVPPASLHPKSNHSAHSIYLGWLRTKRSAVPKKEDKAQNHT